MSLFTVGIRSFGGGYTEDFGSVTNLIIGTFTLVVCLVWLAFVKGYLKQLSVFLIYLVSVAETIGDTSAMASGGLNREATQDEVSGSLAVDGYASAISSLFACPPLSSYSQNDSYCRCSSYDT
ncbi:Permease family protein [Butyrivibrio sp. INlla16]|nr:solute carrier family 23 protein [Butyrivibrio sp. INlla16]SDB33731.1 Permease family protein [Butyrivibrio sp. INlla16]